MPITPNQLEELTSFRVRNRKVNFGVEFYVYIIMPCIFVYSIQNASTLALWLQESKLLDNLLLPFFTGCKHVGVTCEECRITNITGMRWICVKCPDTNLCSRCYHEGKHSLDHEFLRIVNPEGKRYGITQTLASFICS